MSLVKQLWVAIAILMGFALCGALVVSVLGARQYLEQQLQVKNIDNATALALSLSQLPKDDATVELQVAAQFDAGHYRFIRIVSPTGRVVVERTFEGALEGAPTWFASLIPITARPGQAQIQDGWKQYGTVSLASQEQYAYRSLWLSTLEMLGWFLGGGLAAAVAGSAFLRFITRPLDAVVGQAQAIAERRFVTLEEPRTPELRSVTRAMNAMVTRLKTMFHDEAQRLDALRQQVNHDALTGLSTREHFISHLRGVLSGEEYGARGTFMIVRLIDLQELNRRLGRAQADAVIREVGEVLRAEGQGRTGYAAGRLSGGDFAAVSPPSEDAVSAASSLMGRLMSQVHAKWQEQLPDLLHLGAVRYERGQDVGSVLSRANEALARATVKGPNAWHAEQDGVRAPVPSEQWRTLLTEAVDGGRLSLAFFPVVSGDGLGSLHREGVIRLRVEGEDRPLSAGDFMPMATQLNLTAPIDLNVVRMAVEHLKSGEGDIAVNLSAQTVADFAFRTQLTQLLKAYPQVCRRMLFEVPEYGVFQQLDAFRDLTRTLKSLGARVGIEYFGERFAQSEQLADLGLDYIKVEPGYVRGIASNPGNQEFLRGLCRMAHALGITVVALGVESRDDLPLLASLGFDGATGPGIG